jgi:toxin ParE1/3/4
VARDSRSDARREVSFRVRFKPSAERDVTTAKRWYDEQAPGLGLEFLAAVDSAVSRITLNSEAWPVIRSRIRRSALRRFPYLLFYVVDREEVVVLACMHASRDPDRWPS